MDPINVLLADDQALVRGGLAALLQLEDDLHVAAEVATGDAVLNAAREHSVDVCLLDIEMPGMDGISVAEQLARELPETRSMIVTTFGRPGYLRRALEAGVRGFVVKDTPAEELADAIRAVYAGRRVVDPGLATDSLAGGPNPLVEREQQVLRECLDGKSVAAIAASVHLSGGTVRNYLSAAIGKTGTTNRVEAARAAQSRGWL